MINGGIENKFKLMSRIVSTETLQNSTDEMYFSGWTIPANFLRAGDIIHIHGLFLFNTNASAHQAIIYFNKDTNLILYHQTSTSQAWTDNGNILDAYLYIKSVGASGKYDAKCLGVITNAFNYSLNLDDNIDTTADIDITVSAVFNSADLNTWLKMYSLSIDLYRQ